MSAYIVVGESGEPQFVASNVGWAGLCNWIDSLSEDEFENLVHFREHGWDEPASGLRADLASALKKHPPGDSDTEHVAREFAEILANAPDDEIVSASNGVVAGDDQSSSSDFSTGGT